VLVIATCKKPVGEAVGIESVEPDEVLAS